MRFSNTAGARPDAKRLGRQAGERPQALDSLASRGFSQKKRLPLFRSAL